MPAHEYSSLETTLRIATRITAPLMAGTGLLLVIRLVLNHAEIFDVACAVVIMTAGIGYTLRPYLPALQAVVANRWMSRSRS